ncbi:ribosome-recycling factor [Companilactobacillus sp. RD055328]|uniref:ribosome recycling factor n=1 Tax=Companilactobacillus sp. RD055328 TaxID=2916634 RepID=UPI001FC82BFE|nr:ribosome recycling factor [Companilactobacillus sp. RD055328]GKQ42605.1 ribosome-recycling factor [Companilactobacillus sp. RD055328]
MANSAIEDAKVKMQKSQESLQRELGNIRAGKANASILNQIKVNYYGADVPVNQVASVSIPEPRVLMIAPFDESVLEDIERAINMSDLGLAPSNDGSVIRLVIPQLTTETRLELAKKVGKEAENAKVAVRNVRREAMDSIKKQEKNSEISDDELHTLEKDIQKITDDAVKGIDEIAAKKEKEITEG